ncbi:MAG: preprotein translocase subunit YajC [Actinobacteria bacterium]|nr:preprotein translocase subunit YajC [Actinomycetota bacterium]
MEPLLALLFTFVLMWVLLIRPQQRRMREHQAVVASLRPGDEIVTAGGIYGTVQSIDDEAMLLRVAPGVELRVLRAAVSQRVSGTADDLPGDDVVEAPEPRREDDA